MASKHGTPWVEREDFGDVTVVRVKVNRLGDDDTTREIFGQITVLADELRRSKIVLNLAPVQYLQSLALGKLVMLNRKAQAGGGRLALCRLTAHAAETLEVTRLNDLFGIYPEEAEAVASFAGS